MFRTLCRVFNPFSIESFSRSIVAVNWRWIWMYVRFCRTCELHCSRGWFGDEYAKTRWLAGFDRWQTGFYFVATVSFLRYIVTILFTIWVWDWNFLLRFYASVGCTTFPITLGKRNILKEKKNSLVKNYYI